MLLTAKSKQTNVYQCPLYFLGIGRVIHMRHRTMVPAILDFTLERFFGLFGLVL
jgi:hypothetical protein